MRRACLGREVFRALSTWASPCRRRRLLPRHGRSGRSVRRRITMTCARPIRVLRIFPDTITSTPVRKCGCGRKRWERRGSCAFARWCGTTGIAKTPRMPFGRGTASKSPFTPSARRGILCWVRPWRKTARSFEMYGTPRVTAPLRETISAQRRLAMKPKRSTSLPSPCPS